MSVNGSIMRESVAISWVDGAKFLLLIVAIFLTILLMLPLAPWMPHLGLDPSWCVALNEAVAKGLVFGKDIIFTYGPYGSVYTWFYHPSTDRLMLGGSALVAVGLCAGYILIAPPKKTIWLVFLPIVIGLCQLKDAIFLIVPLLLLLATFCVVSGRSSTGSAEGNGVSNVVLLVLAASVGLLPLIKGSFSGIAAIALGFSALIWLISGRRLMAGALCATAIVVMLLGWVISGQPIGALPGFFLSQAPIVSGYTGAMSLQGRTLEVGIWLATVAVFVLAISDGLGKNDRTVKWLVVLGTIFFSFVTFKAAFVRHDGHSLIAANVLLMMALVAVLIGRNRKSIASAVLCLIGSFFINQSVTGEDLIKSINRLRDTSVGALQALPLRIFRGQELREQFDRSREAILDRASFDLLPGSADVYPTELTPIFASGQRWAGRPILQSYSAYTGSLLELNANHLASQGAPEHVYFTVGPIDDRLSSQDDALSWPSLLGLYRPVAFNGIYITLSRDPSGTSAQYGPEIRRIVREGERVVVPVGTDLLWVKLDVRPTSLGKLVLGAYKLPPVLIELTLESNEVVVHRIIPDVARYGFLLSPYVASARDFLTIAAGGNSDHVKSFRVIANEPAFWRNEVDVSMRTLDVERHPEALKLLSAPAVAPVVSDPADCALDKVERRNEAILHVAGWVSPSIGKGIVPEEIWAMLKDHAGKRTSIRLPIQARPDVAKAFDKPSLTMTGFDAAINVEGLTGDLKFLVKAVADGQAYLCSQQVSVR